MSTSMLRVRLDGGVKAKATKVPNAETRAAMAEADEVMRAQSPLCQEGAGGVLIEVTGDE